jgi:hypothetical protein
MVWENIVSLYHKRKKMIILVERKRRFVDEDDLMSYSSALVVAQTYSRKQSAFAL